MHVLAAVVMLQRVRGVFSVVGGRLAISCCLALACIGLSACGAGGSPGEEGAGARVTGVIDGDTVDVEGLGRVRLIGVDTPEKGRCGDDAATRFTRARLLGQVVEYELGVEPEDRYERTLAYLSREGQMHNRALLSEGYAKVLTIPPNDKYAAEFEQAEREARPVHAGSLATCDRNRRRAEARREREEEKARRAAALRRERAREARRAARAEARRLEREAQEQEFSAPEEDSGGGGGGGGGSRGGGGSCLPSSACPGRRDGDGDGCYCE